MTPTFDRQEHGGLSSRSLLRPALAGACTLAAMILAGSPALAQNPADPEQSEAQNSEILTGPVAVPPAWCMGEASAAKMFGRIDGDSADDFVCHRRTPMSPLEANVWTARSDRGGRFRQGRDLGSSPCNGSANIVPYRRTDGRLSYWCQGMVEDSGSTVPVFGRNQNLEEYGPAGMVYQGLWASPGTRLVLGRDRKSPLPHATIALVADTIREMPFAFDNIWADHGLVLGEDFGPWSLGFGYFTQTRNVGMVYEGYQGLMDPRDAANVANAMMIDDFDNDGRTDLLVQHRAASAYQAGRQAGDVWGTSLTLSATGNSTTAATPLEWSDQECTGEMQKIDLRANGRIDFVCAYPATTGNIWTARTLGSPGTLQAWNKYADGECLGGVVVVGDFDGDSHQDIACVRSSGEKRVIRTKPSNYNVPYPPETWSAGW